MKHSAAPDQRAQEVAQRLADSHSMTLDEATAAVALCLNQRYPFRAILDQFACDLADWLQDNDLTQRSDP